jgi:pSer/pThr/pTyr-binding forkhead associated (FHA) protein
MVKVRQGALGGILGGALGGILFDLVATMTHGGSVSRFVGFTITGLAIGVAVGLIEEFKKVYWLTVLTGGREGRNYILTRPTTVLGRDELVDVPLFGDSTVLKQHANIVLAPSGATLIARPGTPALVNGAYMPQVALKDGDIMEFGRHRLRFHQRSDAAQGLQMTQQDLRPQTPVSQSYYGQPTLMSTVSATDVCQVKVVQGPHTGSMFVLTDGAIMGRDERCDIALIGDNHLSRQHARFCLEGTNWVVEDGNSTNGVYVNGVRVGRHILARGDQISAGETVLHIG